MSGPPAFSAIAQSLVRRARARALARAEMRRRARRQEAGRWRKPQLLWPQFTDRSL